CVTRSRAASCALYALSLHDALPIWLGLRLPYGPTTETTTWPSTPWSAAPRLRTPEGWTHSRSSCGKSRPTCCAHSCATTKLSCRSEEHTSELQSRENLVCRLLLEKK